MKKEARAAGLLEEGVICFIPDCLSSGMISGQAGRRFSKSCLIRGLVALT